MAEPTSLSNVLSVAALEDELSALADPRSLPIDLRAVVQRSTMLRSRTDLDDRVRAVEPARPEDVDRVPADGTEEAAADADTGLAEMRAGRVAMVVLAGGMATRMGGVVKAVVEALPGRTFLDLRLEQRDRWEREGADVPLWLMTSTATDATIRLALGSRLDGRSLATFQQPSSVRLTPDGELFRGADGQPQLYPTGHGDVVDALWASGLLDHFRARGGRWLMVANADNLGATLDPRILGWHIRHRAPLTLEVVERRPGDRGGSVVRLDGRPVVLEDIRLPPDFDVRTSGFFSTNTIWVDATHLASVDQGRSYVAVTKTVEGRPAVQFERILNELALVLEARFLVVPRDGPTSRFLPVKDEVELVRRRPEIMAAVQPRP